ncbi:hypothetical protein BC830DRAFT_1101570 [Chytriomyces sp. MP71]|nr:hypothetical protein BC830DRAFT_1101570 [Chytriomyces sp. MP71]
MSPASSAPKSCALPSLAATKMASPSAPELVPQQPLSTLPPLRQTLYFEKHRRQIPCEPCRTLRKKCDSTRPGDACSRCIQLGGVCHFTDRKPYTRRTLPKTMSAASATLPSSSATGFGGLSNPDEVHGHVMMPRPSYSAIYADSSQPWSPPTLCVDDNSIRSLSSANASVSPQMVLHTPAPLALPNDHGAKRALPCDCCRQQKKKCDRIRPACTSCLQRGLDCKYILPPKKLAQQKWVERLETENLLMVARSPLSHSSQPAVVHARPFSSVAQVHQLPDQFAGSVQRPTLSLPPRTTASPWQHAQVENQARQQMHGYFPLGSPCQTRWQHVPASLSQPSRVMSVAALVD